MSPIHPAQTRPRHVSPEDEPDDAKIILLLTESEKAFSSEADRRESLTQKAEKYIAASGAVTGIYLVGVDPSKLPDGWRRAWYLSLAMGALLVLAASLIAMLMTMRVREFSAYPRKMTLLEQLRPPEVTANVARIMMASMYLNAHETNASINDRRARLLKLGGILMTAGFALAVISRLLTKL
jgi:hypothetical protein